ncbi:MAG: hypothetical protein ACE5PM_02900 [Candidatus Hydrothermarchaeales archaeon]
MKKFSNVASKANAIVGVFRDGERLKGKEIVRRLKARGYRVKEENIRMFIYHHMLYKHLRKEAVQGINYYSLIY